MCAIITKTYFLLWSQKREVSALREVCHTLKTRSENKQPHTIYAAGWLFLLKFSTYKKIYNSKKKFSFTYVCINIFWKNLMEREIDLDNICQYTICVQNKFFTSFSLYYNIFPLTIFTNKQNGIYYYNIVKIWWTSIYRYILKLINIGIIL